MAFNPFHAFRKHQKIVFAALTIICMLTFVMAGGSFAGGDFFSELTRLIGRSRTVEVATVYGRRISDHEIQELRRQRHLANNFMKQAVWQAHNNIIKSIDLKSDELTKRELAEIFFYRDLAGQRPDFARVYLQNLPRYMGQVDKLQRTLVALKNTPEADTLSQLQLVLQQESWLFQQLKDELYPEDDLYFGGSTSAKGLLDFIIWRHQADRLGIELTTDDIVNQYRHETLNRVESGMILRQLQLPMDSAAQQSLRTAIGEEFRVRMAQAALLGFDPGGSYGQVPTAITPYEFWEYYRTNRTELNLKLLPLAVQKFVPEVKDRPSDADLEGLFEKYKEEEPAPFKDTPGFKRPRRIRAEWIAASPDSDYYRKQAHAWLLSLVASTPVNPLVPTALLYSPVNEYETLKSWNFKAPALTEPNFAYAFYGYSYLRRPENVTATVAQALGVAGGQGSPLSTLVAYQSGAVARAEKDLAPVVAREAQRRVPFSCAIFSTGTSATPALALAEIWQYAAKKEEYLPMELVKGELVDKLRENTADTLTTLSLDAFKTELEAIKKELDSKKAKPADAEKRVEKAVRDRGWAHGVMAELRDQYEMTTDPKQLAPLKEAYVRDFGSRDTKGKAFAQSLFFSQPSDQWKLFTPKELTSRPSFESSEKKTYLYWKTDDEPPKVLTFSQARPEVEAAWRMEKARALAQKKAEELAAQARQTHGDYLPILNEAGKHYGPVFELNGVARWAKPALSSRAEPSAGYQPYQVPDDKIEYPLTWPAFVDLLLEHLKQAGDTTVVSNRPKDIYYVVALARRDAPTTRDFYKDTRANRDLLLGQLELERRKDYRQAFLQQLQVEAKLSLNEEGLERVKERPSLRDE